jgi:uncharacterized protein with von Willebrand factor type A (vWA) domain
LEEYTALADALNALPSYTKGGRDAREPIDVILVSDGSDTCGGDVCAAAARFNKQRPHARIHVIAIGRRLQGLRCISDRTGGAFLEPQDIKQLSGYFSEIPGESARRRCKARLE